MASKSPPGAAGCACGKVACSSAKLPYPEEKSSSANASWLLGAAAEFCIAPDPRSASRPPVLLLANTGSDPRPSRSLEGPLLPPKRSPPFPYLGLPLKPGGGASFLRPPPIFLGAAVVVACCANLF